MAEQNCFKRQHRLLKPADFKRVFENAKRTSTPVLTILYRKNSLEHPRLGMAIAKKQLPKAVQRNKIKRLIRDSFRHHAAIMDNYDVVVMVRKDIWQLTNASIYAMLRSRWLKLAKDD